MILNRNIFILFVSLVSLAACKGKKEDPKAKGGRPTNLSAEGYVVQASTFQSNYIASGSLLPNEAIEIHPEISGRVTAIKFEEGSRVRKGQVLVEVNAAEINAQIQKLRAQKQLYNKLQERQKDLVDIGGISQQEYETTLTQVKSMEADIAFAEAQLRSSKIVAPFDGVIGIRNISNGAIVTPATLIAVLQQLHPLKMDFTLPDQYRNMVQSGKEVMFSLKGSQDTMSGKISAVDPGADPTTRTIRVRAIVPNPDNKLTAGSFAQVIIPFSSDANAILIPSQAVIPTTRDKKVAIVRNGKADLVVVTLGTRTADKVEVLSGLQSGDTVITTGIMQVKPGMDVKITKVKS